MTITLNWYYILYFWGAFLTLCTKWMVYVRKGKKEFGMTIAELTSEWFFEKSSENYGSWIATVAAVWAGGALYVEKLPFPYLDSLFALPQHLSIAFLLGCVMEMAAPFLIKWLIRKIPGADV